MLLMYKKKSKVSDHVSSSTGHFNLNNATDVKIGESGCDITVTFDSKKETLIIQTFSSCEGTMWFKGICRVVYEGRESPCDDVEEGIRLHEHPVFVINKPYIFCRSMLASGGSLSSVETCDHLPTHSGYLTRINVLTYSECKYYDLRQPGVLYGYKSLSEATRGANNSSKMRISLQDVLSVTQNRDDMCIIEINVKDKSIKFEALSEKLACDWCEVIIKWLVYFTELSNASLCSTQIMMRDNAISGSSSFTSTNISGQNQASVEMVQAKSVNISRPGSDSNGIAFVNCNEELGDFYLMKIKTTMFSTVNWQRRWVFVDAVGNLTISTNKPNNFNDPSFIKESVHLSNIIAVEVCPVNACCLYIHESGIHHEIKANSVLNAISLRNCLLNKIFAFCHKDFNNYINFIPFKIHSQTPPEDDSTREIVADVLESLMQNVEFDAHGMDAVEIEPFSKGASIFNSLDSGLNPLESYLNHTPVSARRSTKLDKHD